MKISADYNKDIEIIVLMADYDDNNTISSLETRGWSADCYSRFLSQKHRIIVR